MLHSARLIAQLVGARLARRLLDTHPEAQETAQGVAAIAGWALEIMGRGGAPYHDTNHVAVVAETAALILTGREALGIRTDPDDWYHLLAAALLHDIGYVRGLLPGDATDRVSTGQRGETMATNDDCDGALAPLHVDRGIAIVRQRLAHHPHLDIQRLVAGLERTRFPVPPGPLHAADGDEPGLLRGADLLGQLGDRRYIPRLCALAREQREEGNADMTAEALWQSLPAFYSSVIAPYIGPSEAALAATPDGRALLSRLARYRAGARAGRRRISMV